MQRAERHRLEDQEIERAGQQSRRVVHAFSYLSQEYGGGSPRLSRRSLPGGCHHLERNSRTRAMLPVNKARNGDEEDNQQPEGRASRRRFSLPTDRRENQ